jgi:hypothetical protein
MTFVPLNEASHPIFRVLNLALFLLYEGELCPIFSIFSYNRNFKQSSKTCDAIRAHFYKTFNAVIYKLGK